VDTIDWYSDEPFFAEKIKSSYTITHLNPATIYYVRVNAVNEQGEGYTNKEAFFIKTMSEKIDHCDSLYVWGNNASNELGLPDDA
jgi:alpha-tubulin suppressor-like RCC1 family protein